MVLDEMQSIKAKIDTRFNFFAKVTLFTGRLEIGLIYPIESDISHFGQSLPITI